MAEALVQYAGFWRRFAALLVDLLLMLPVYVALQKIGFGPYVADAINLLLLCIIYALFLSSRWQATPGMRLLHVAAVDVQHARLDSARVARWCGVSVVGILIVFAPVLSVTPTPQMQEINHKVLEAKFAGQDPLSVFNDYTPEQVTAYAEQAETLRKRTPLMLLLVFGWIATIVLSKQKAGVHNLLSGVRFVKGRVEA